ncbi:hypothetical protein FI667_g1202, partial [Globisporangium splendens]
MEAAQQYEDPRAFEEYIANGGTEVVASIIVDTSTKDAWFQHVWLDTTHVVAPGDPANGYVGHARGMPLGVQEKIVSVGLPSEDEDKILSVCYKVYNVGIFPVSDHIGLVRFIVLPPPAASSHHDSRAKTLVLWTIKTMPTPVGNVVLCGGASFRLMLRIVINAYLRKMQARLHALKTNE